MFRFTIRDVLWLTVVVAMGVVLWIKARQAHELELERKLWETRALQLKSQVESGDDATVEFLPTKTSVTFGKKQFDARVKSAATAIAEPNP